MSNNTPKFNFGIRKPEEDIKNNLFAVTDPENINPYEIKNIQINKLVPFKNHPFKLYEGQRFDDMCESVRENGVLLPIIVRPADGGNYEILSGHNRTEAAKAAELEVIPAIIREGLTDTEAMLIVTETNLIQRSFTDLSHSERAVTLAMHHEAIKRQGKRTDLVNEIENLLKNTVNISNNGASETSSQLANKSTTMYKIGEEYGLSKDTVARYLRINRLIDGLKKRLDNKEFGIIPAVEISYLSEDEQDKLHMILDSPMYKLDMKKAGELREFSEKKKLSTETIEEILAGLTKKKSNSNKPQKITLKPKILSRFFTHQEKAEEIESVIIKALELYMQNNSRETVKAAEKSDEIEMVEETEDDEDGYENMGDDTG